MPQQQPKQKSPSPPSQPKYTREQLEAFEEIDRDGGNVRADAIVTTPEGLKVRRPQQFLPDAPVIGDLEFQLMVRELQKRIPHADVSKIVKGHTGPSMIAHAQSNMKPDAFGRSTLLGIYGLKDKSIGIRTGMEPDLMRDTLVHELAHSRGFKEDDAERLGNNFNGDEELRTVTQQLEADLQKAFGKPRKK